MRSLEFDPAAFEDLAWWVQHDRKKALRIINLIQEIQRDPFGGSGADAVYAAVARNKQLPLAELINLFRLHYQKTWEKHYGVDHEGCSRWPRQRDVHAKLLANFRSLLLRYGFHGYGNPNDDNGIVVFAPDRLILKELITEVPPPDYD